MHYTYTFHRVASVGDDGRKEPEIGHYSNVPLCEGACSSFCLCSLVYESQMAFHQSLICSIGLPISLACLSHKHYFF